MKKKNIRPKRRRPYRPAWNDPYAKLTLYASPQLKEKLQLKCPSTEQGLQKLRWSVTSSKPLSRG